MKQWGFNYWETYSTFGKLDKYEFTIRYSKYI